jgi:hypothetical protein
VRGPKKPGNLFPSGSEGCDGTYHARYGVQSPGYTTIPGAASSTITSYGESLGNPKAWSSALNMPHNYSVVYPDTAAGSQMGISAYPGVAPSSPASSLIIPSPFPTVSRPTKLSFNGENPINRSGNVGAISMAPTDLAGPGLSLIPGQFRQSQGHCDPKGCMSTKCEASAGVMSSNLSGLAANRRPLSCQGMAYGFMPNAGASSSRLATSNTTYLGVGRIGSDDQTDATATSGDRGSLMLPDSNSCDTVYSYTSREKDKHRSIGSNLIPSETLTDSLPYACPGTPVALLNAPFNLLQTNATTEYQASAAPPKSPITSLANPGCY